MTSPKETRDDVLAVAEMIDALRVVPRILIISFGAFAIGTVWDLLDWYQHLPGEERGVEASGFAFACVTAIAGLFTQALKLYQETGRRWGHDE